MLPVSGMDLGATSLLIMGALMFGVLLTAALPRAPIEDPQPSGAHLRTPNPR